MHQLFDLFNFLSGLIQMIHPSHLIMLGTLGLVMSYDTLTDLDRAKYNSYIRVKAAQLVLHPQFFEQKGIESAVHAAVFTVWDKLSAAVADTLLTGTYTLTNPDPTSLVEAQKTVTAYERGKVTATMQAARVTSILDLAEAQKDIVAINLAEGLDNAAAYGIYGALTVADTLGGPITWTHALKTARDFEDAVPKFEDGLYGAIISPFTKYDLFGDADTLKGFIPVTKYTNPGLVYNYELGARFGFRWAVGGSAYHATTDGARHDYPLFFGSGAFGQANGYDPEMVIKSGLDTMDRILYVSWKAQRGYGVICTDYARNYDCIPTA